MTKFQDFSRLEKLSPFFQVFKVFQELWEPWKEVLQAAIDALTKYADNTGLKINYDKSVIYKIGSQTIRVRFSNGLMTILMF